MAFTNETTHYGLPQWIGSDKPTYLVDQNNAYQKIDSEIYNANVTAGEAVTTANGASSTAGAASSTAADALSAAQTASTTADNALTAAQNAGTVAQAAQTAAGAAQTAAQAAQEAAAGNSITNLAPAYDNTIPYAIDDLVTQDGKLYKCIVAVTSPEHFDINKWDDVTTSEVYARTHGNMYAITTSRYTFPSDTSKTRSQFIEDALAAFITNVTSHLADDEYIIITNVHFDYLDLLFETFFKFSNSTSAFPNYTKFSAITLISDQYLSIDVINYLNTATFKYAQIDTTNSNVSSGDKGILTNETDMIISYTKYKKI